MPYFKKHPDTKLPLLVDVAEWHEKFQEQDPVIARTQVGPVLVETFFRGHDFTYQPKGPPELWRTRANCGGPGFPKQKRYATEFAALEGHAEYVAALEAMKPEQLAAGAIEVDHGG